jgi:hypothetical protein
LDIVENQSIGSTKSTKLIDIDEIQFIRYYWSSNMTEYQNIMSNRGFAHQPDLQKASTFKHAIFSRRVIMLYGKKLKTILPENHFTITHLMLIPIVVNKISVALVGLANGCYTDQDSLLLHELLPKLWTNVVLESVKISQKEEENDQRLKKIAKRVEESQKLLKGKK